MSNPREAGWSRLMLLAGAILSAVSLVATFLLFLQPWASCPEIDDSSAGCPAGTGQVLILGGVFVLLLVGVALILAGLQGKSRTRPPT